MTDETPKDVEPQTPEADEEAAATAAAAEEEAKPKPRRRSRAKKAEAEKAAAEPTAEEATDEAAEPVAGEAPDVAASDDDEDEIEPTPEDEEAADEAASEEEPDEDEEAEEEAEEPAPAAGRRRRGRRSTEEAPAPAPRRSRSPGQAVVVRAQAKYVRTSARKARLVCDHIRGKSVQEARAILALTPRAVARDWSKLLESAVANAEHNHELLGDDLRIASVTADEGPTLKRFRPRAMGRATRIRKRTSHLTILLTPKEF
jgi:ribosomal protein L22